MYYVPLGSFIEAIYQSQRIDIAGINNSHVTYATRIEYTFVISNKT